MLLLVKVVEWLLKSWLCTEVYSFLSNGGVVGVVGGCEIGGGMLGRWWNVLVIDF